MHLLELAHHLRASVATHSAVADRVQIVRIFAANRISELLCGAAPDTLLVSDLANPHLLQVALLLDAPGLCLASNVALPAGLVEAADQHGKVLLSSPFSLQEPCCRARNHGLACVELGR
jgi:hypothetical protein